MNDKPASADAVPFLERVGKGVVVFDGAMGTMLYARGVFVNRCFDELNLSNPNLVRSIHEEYLAAGAEIIEANTYGAHRFKLGPHGLAPHVRKINREGARIAREAAEGRGLVAGAMGPIGKPMAPLGHVSRDEAIEAFREQAEGLVEGSVDVFLIETMPSLDQATAALEAVRSVAADVPVIVSLTFNEEGNTIYGDTPEDVVRELEALDVPVDRSQLQPGSPGHARDDPADGGGDPHRTVVGDAQRGLACSRRGSLRLPLHPRVHGHLGSALPRERCHRGRRVLRDDPRPREGPRALGADGSSGTRTEVQVHAPRRPKEAPKPVDRESKSPLARSLGRKFVVSVELDPPRGASPGVLLERAQYCRESEVDAINVADGPRASARMSAQALCVLLQTQVGIDTILHYTCRDRNLLGIQSDLLGAQALGLRNILAITGDPPKLGDYPDATAVYDVDSIGLIRILDHLNHGCDLAGNLIGPALGFHIGCGADPSKPDMEKEVGRLEEKVEAGAEYVMTQPVYDPRTLERFLGMITHLEVPLLVGILPLYSHRNAEFLHNEVPGMSIPEDIRERMQKAGSGEKAQAEGVSIAQEATLAAREKAQGVYIMPPFNKVDLAVRVIEVLD